MIQVFFLLIGLFIIVWGIVICDLLIIMSIRVGKAVWLVTVPGILIIALLATDFACHVFHLPRHVIPQQARVVGGINAALQLAAVPLLLLKLSDIWVKRRARNDRRMSKE